MSIPLLLRLCSRAGNIRRSLEKRPSIKQATFFSHFTHSLHFHPPPPSTITRSLKIVELNFLIFDFNLFPKIFLRHSHYFAALIDKISRKHMAVNKSEAKADSTKLAIATGFLPYFFRFLAHADLKAFSFITRDDQAHS